ncbi:MAG: hypothetical protein PHI10_05065 [Dehalococcoidales bacterium]|nr:hypothetical protein [Dehalococcoidales bacterium]
MELLLILEIMFGLACVGVVSMMVILTCVSAHSELNYEKKVALGIPCERGNDFSQPPWEIVSEYKKRWGN